MTVALSSRIEGDGAPLLLMHGLFGSGRNWQSVQRGQASRWQVHALDLRNHGGSAWADTMTYRQMADDVLTYMDHHGQARAAVLGHSMGGKVAMALALAAPQRIDALIVVDIAPLTYSATLRPYLRAMQHVDLATVASRRDVDALLADGVPDAGIRGFLLQNLVSTKGSDNSTPTRWRWRINLAAIDRAMDGLGGFDVDQAAPAPLSCPVMALYGEDSPYMDASARAAFVHWFPRAQISGIANAGHWVHAEQPAAFAERLTNFLAPLSSAPP